MFLGALMALLLPSDVVLTNKCKAKMREYRVELPRVLAVLSHPYSTRKANPQTFTQHIWKAERAGIGVYYRWEGSEHKWVILSCWRYGRGMLKQREGVGR